MTAPAVETLRLTRRHSRILYHWRGDRFDLDPLTRVVIGGAGDVATVLTRNATAAPADSAGTTRTVVRAQAAWEIVDWDGDAVRETPALLLGASDKCITPCDIRPQALTWSLEFVENGTITIVSAAVAYIGNAGNTGARLWVDSTGTFYRTRHHNGTTEVSSTLAAAPSVGNRVVLRVTLDSSGRIQLRQSINGAAESAAAQSGTNTLASAWSGFSLYLGTTGDTNPGNTKLVRVKLDAGDRTALQMQDAW